tara:strand:- start:194 stop:1306 length:1113 start_codon:yes stop_codon:yes gene_type:complete
MKKIKNIIVLYPSFERGGATVNLINFVNACDKKNINIHLITNITIKDQKKFFNKSIKIIKIKDISKLNSFGRFFTSFFSSLKLIKLFKTIETKNSLVFSFQSHILPILISKIFGRKIIFRNSEDIIGATKYADNKFIAYLIFFLKLLFYNFSDGIITNSSKSKESLDKIIIKKKTKLIFNPYLKKIDKSRKIAKKKHLLSIGRLCKQKNQRIIIKAFSIFLQKYPNYKLILVGHGPDEKKLINFCKKLNIKKNVIFKGWIKHPKNFYLNSKVLLFPSLYEGLPNTLIDAVNYNLPCISSRCSGAEDILTKKFGIFAPHDDPKFLAKKIEFVIKNYRDVNLNVLRIKKKLNRFLIQSQTSKYLNYCQDVLK